MQRSVMTVPSLKGPMREALAGSVPLIIFSIRTYSGLAVRRGEKGKAYQFESLLIPIRRAIYPLIAHTPSLHLLF
jgi:hypothetical protein